MFSSTKTTVELPDELLIHAPALPAILLELADDARARALLEVSPVRLRRHLRA